MELEDKSIRLETMGGKEPYSREEPRVLSIMNHAKNSLTSSFKYSQRNKIRTEPSEMSLRTSNNQEKPQRDSNFSEEYLSLVRKLKVNLSKDYFHRKKHNKFIREKQTYYKEDNYQKMRHFSVNSRAIMQLPPQIQRPNVLSSRKYSNRTQQQRVIKSKTPFNHVQSFQRHGKSRMIEMTRLKLTYQKKSQQKEKRNRSEDRIDRIHISARQNQTEEVRFRQKVAKKQKFGALKKERKKLLVQVQPQTLADEQDLNLKYGKYLQLIFHVEILIGIYENITLLEVDSNNQIQLMKRLKSYILGNKKVVKGGEEQVITDDISHIQTIYKDQSSQKDLKNMVFLQRILVVMIVDLNSCQKLSKYIPEIKQVLQNTMGLYLYLIYSLSHNQNNNASLQSLQKSISRHNIHIKKQVTPLSIFLFKKVMNLMKSNQFLLGQIKILITQFQKRNISINRSFYELLKLYAIYLNNNEHLVDRNFGIMKTFATCPSPYLTKGLNKKYTLVLDLDQTLVYVREEKKKISLFLRPFLKQFLALMNEHFQIVIFTSSMPAHSQDIINTLPHISHKLFRYHTTRLKSRNVKDLSRLGRPLKNIVIIDNEEQNYVMHRQNGIKIPEWTGFNPADQELNIIGLFLSKMAEEETEDVRQYLVGYRQFRDKYY